MLPKTILITGASSGIGAALAAACASQGRTLWLWGRDSQRLNATAERCRALGAQVETECFDLRDMETLISRLSAGDDRLQIDLAIFNAGLGGMVPADQLSEDARAAQAMADVNFTAPVVSASLLADRMARRGGGQIVLIGSIADSFPLPMAPVYSGAKAGLAMFAEALGLRMKKHGITVTLVSPAFVDTPMSRSVTAPKPFLLSAEAAAAIIKSKIERRATNVVLPWQFAVIRTVSRFLPRAVTRAVLRRI